MLNNIKSRPDGSIDVKFTVEGLSNDNGPAAWTEQVPMHSKDRWTKFDVAKTVGPEAVLKEFGMKEGDGIPIVAIVECLDWDGLRRWSGDIQIRIEDYNGDRISHELAQPFKVKLGKPRFAQLPGTSCK
ncbi:hypothetical protein [Bradyrhizobium sp. 87]|uniref:hypothetical protein n=1 Tax=Bradyrhizobium sp. 87 TaxID=2782682 RepID=UPI001FF8682C|nr:hypothetical protein [Bradyrhizobium sp. 87]MCK1431407.1 hypothetical protein [Bradyrhizobium sp. 87]